MMSPHPVDLALTPGPFPVGALVHDESGQQRMVVGYKPDGRCMTVGAPDLPWMRAGRAAIEVRPVRAYRPARAARWRPALAR